MTDEMRPGGTDPGSETAAELPDADRAGTGRPAPPGEPYPGEAQPSEPSARKARDAVQSTFE